VLAVESARASRTRRGSRRMSAYRRYALAKRLLDLAICLASLPIALLVMLVLATAIRIDSSGPAIFIQSRVGRGGRTFRMYKFRTLRKDYDDRNSRAFMQAFVRGKIGQDEHTGGLRLHKPTEGAQVTRVGRVLRATSLDELPQLFNVLRGEMSLVGPRPNVPWEAKAYQIWHTERLEVLPGITGLAQVRGRSSIPFQRIARYDIEYVRKRSLQLDLQILWWTVLAVLSGRGAG